ncbi:hypothetical protein FM996_21230 [Methylosinus sporium]|uniref:Uncharacterized protein n=1 Tax=Methylosinus sporium TaxID=428 RepID=A0A549SCN0_METSR|nr:MULTISPECIES: hypothetical protein [Methylosinus]TRL22624.1 hypothetical protein FM996_21230 [Methylosinus sporium]BBU63980.1 hypothetical protein MSC49_39150 [Methylosinus sp. C49]
MQIVEKLKQLPIVITLVGWALFYSWLFSMAGLGLSVTTVLDLAERQELVVRFAMTMSFYLVLATFVSCAVYLFVFASWARHFLSHARQYRLADIAMVPAVGVCLAGVSALFLGGPQ